MQAGIHAIAMLASLATVAVVVRFATHSTQEPKTGNYGILSATAAKGKLEKLHHTHY